MAGRAGEIAYYSRAGGGRADVRQTAGKLARVGISKVESMVA